MKNILEKVIQNGQIFKLIPNDVSYASKAAMVEISDEEFRVELLSDDIKGYNVGDKIEFFTTTGDGLLYFVSEIKEIDKNFLTVSIPSEHKYLQRREYTRVFVNEKVSLSNKNVVTIQDISAGGMKIFSDVQLNLDEEYTAGLFIGKKDPVEVNFQPIRIDICDKGGYTVSGRFKNLKNIDRISLVQFCFKKQIENQNK